MITLQTLRDLTLSIGAAALAALAVDELTDNALRRSQPLPPTQHGWLYTPSAYGHGVRRLRPATATEDAASAQSWADGNGGWIALGANGEISSLSDPRVLTHATRPGQGDVGYVSDRPALDTQDTLGVQLRRLTVQLRTLTRQHTALAAARLGYWHSTDIDPTPTTGGDQGVDVVYDDMAALFADLNSDPAETTRLTADVIAFTEHAGVPHVLLIRRAHEPYAGRWALPGGHVDPHETTQSAAARELAEETGIDAATLHPIGTYTTPGRDPRGRYITTAYRTDLPGLPTPVADDDAAAADWVPLPAALATELAFDHGRILRDALAWTPAPLTGVDALLDEADELLVQGALVDEPTGTDPTTAVDTTAL